MTNQGNYDTPAFRTGTECQLQSRYGARSLPFITCDILESVFLA
jgi:hypothetical protein